MINQEINKNYIELSKFEDAFHIAYNMGLPRCVIELLENKISDLKSCIVILEKEREKIHKSQK